MNGLLSVRTTAFAVITSVALGSVSQTRLAFFQSLSEGASGSGWRKVPHVDFIKDLGKTLRNPAAGLKTSGDVEGTSGSDW